ncbi:MAG: hypothetical protein AAFY64_11500, partial [Pseudomonadota bacterium]
TRRGELGASSDVSAGLSIRRANFDFRLDNRSHRIEMGPSRVIADGIDVTLVGVIRQLRDQRAWTISINATEGFVQPAAVASPAGQSRRVKIDRFRVRGRYEPDLNSLNFEQILLAVADGVITATGSITQRPTTTRAVASNTTRRAQSGPTDNALQYQLRGEISSFGLETIKAVWPPNLMPGPRAWFVSNTAQGAVTNGRFAIETPDPRRLDVSGVNGWRTNTSLGTAERIDRGNLPNITADIALQGVRFRGLEALPWIDVPSARLQLAGRVMEVKADRGKLVIPQNGGTADMTGLTYRQARVWTGDQGGEASFKIAGDVKQALATLADPAFGIDAGDLLRRGARGKITADIGLVLPSVVAVEAAIARGDTMWPALTGTAKVTDGAVRHARLPHEVTRGQMTIELGSRAISLQGDMRIGGVPAKVAWQYLVGDGTRT